MKKHLENPLLIWLILILALFLRIPHLTGSFWLDEAAQALESSRPLAQQLMIKEDFQPPLMHLIVHFMTQVSQSEWWLRLSSLGSGLIMIWATYLIAKKVTNQKIAVFTALLLAFNSFHIFYSQELRPYALTGLWVSLGWLFIIKMTEHTIIKPKLLIGFIICCIAGMYSTYLFPFALLGQLLYLASRRSKVFFIQALMAGLVTALAFLPWLPALSEQMSVSNELRVNVPDWETVVSTPQLKAIQLVFGKFLFGVVDLELNVFFIAISLVFMIVTILTLWKVRSRIGVNTALIIGCWFVLPVFSIWIFSFFIPVLQPKRVLFALPAFELLVAMLVVYGWEWKKSRITTLALAVILISTHLVGTLSYYYNPIYQRENWRSAIFQIDLQFAPTNTIVVFGFDHPFSPWEWYPHQQFSTLATGTRTLTEYSQVEPSMARALEYENVIVFDYLTDLTDPNHYIEAYLQKYNYQQGQVIDLPNLGFVRVFTKGGSFADNTQRHN